MSPTAPLALRGFTVPTKHVSWSAVLKSFAGLQIRSAVFAPLVDVLGRCMATRHVLPQDDLWRTAAAAFNAVVVAGLPAINIAHVSGQPIGGAWEALATALEVFLLADAGHCDASFQTAADQLGPSISTAEAAHISSAPQHSLPDWRSASAREGDRGGRGQPGSAPQLEAAADSNPEQAAKDSELEVSVLDTLTDSVLTSCPYASESMRKRLVQIVDRCEKEPLSKSSPDTMLLAQTLQESLWCHRGISRADRLNFRPGAAGSSFEHVCLRKLYVLSSRGEGNQGPDGCLLEVAQVTPSPPS